MKLNKYISSISQSLTPDDYSRALDSLSGWLSSDSFSVGERETIVRLSILLLRDHPQSEYKYRSLLKANVINVF